LIELGLDGLDKDDAEDALETLDSVDDEDADERELGVLCELLDFEVEDADDPWLEGLDVLLTLDSEDAEDMDDPWLEELDTLLLLDSDDEDELFTLSSKSAKISKLSPTFNTKLSVTSTCLVWSLIILTTTLGTPSMFAVTLYRRGIASSRLKSNFTVWINTGSERWKT